MRLPVENSLEVTHWHIGAPQGHRIRLGFPALPALQLFTHRQRDPSAKLEVHKGKFERAPLDKGPILDPVSVDRIGDMAPV